MSHRSEIGVICIDRRTDDPGDAADFRSKAPDGQATTDADGERADVAALGGIRVLSRAVDHAPRAHLDIETDDRDAGAKLVTRVETWAAMEAPTGRRFCAAGSQTDALPGEAKEWSA